jgi:TRAP-type C4-dicarboxylate transport system permease small subunit
MDGRLQRLVHSLEKTIFPVSNFLNIIAQWIIVLMVLLTVADVCLRYIFNRPITGSYELTEFMMVILVFASVAYTMSCKEHVKVDLVTERLPEKVQGVLECFVSFIAFILFAIVSWRNALHAITMWNRNDVSAELFIPVSPFVLFVALGTAILSLVLLVQFLQSLLRMVQK